MLGLKQDVIELNRGSGGTGTQCKVAEHFGLKERIVVFVPFYYENGTQPAYHVYSIFVSCLLGSVVTRHDYDGSHTIENIFIHISRRKATAKSRQE